MSEQICKKIPKLQSGDIMYPRPKKPPRKRFQERSPFNDDLPKERHKLLKKLEDGAKIDFSNRAYYNKLDPGMRYGDFLFAAGDLIDGQKGQRPRTGPDLATEEEEAYWKHYLGLGRDKRLIPNTKARVSTDKEDGKHEYVGMPSTMIDRVQAIGDSLNLGKIYRNYDKYQKQFGKLPTRETVGEVYEFSKKLLNNPGKWQIANESLSMKKPIKNSGLGALKDFGMRWDRDKGQIKVQDTYDFPWYVSWALPGRDKSLEIREDIKFDPLKGSKILRDPNIFKKLK